MRCPKCESEFETVTFADVEVDRCSGCGAIWFDAREKERLQKLENARSIDVGDKRVGRQYNEIRNIECPRCGVSMLTMVDATQFHIEFESCPSCYGTFFDAGEFKDLTELTLLERIRKILDLSLSIR